VNQPSSWSLQLPDGQRVPLGAAGVRLGREQGSCDVLLASGKVSRTHALVWVDEQGQPWVRDLGSANGTAVDGARVTEQQLRDGSLLQLGDVQVRVARSGGGGNGGAPSSAPMGEQGFVFGGGGWARITDLPSASPIFDRDAMAPVVLPGAGASNDVPQVDDGGGGGLGKILVFFAILLLGALVFFDLRRTKLLKEQTELLTKSDLATARTEAQRMHVTRQLVERGELVPQPIAICNVGTAVVTLDWIGAAIPAPHPIPGEHVLETFNSDLPETSCQARTIDIAPGARLALADLQQSWPGCKLPPTAFLLTAGRIHGEAKDDYVAGDLLTKANPCLRVQ
jgi:hypothetical protein